MSESEIMEKVINILSPYAKNKEALKNATTDTSILKELEVNSSRLVDIIIAFEDEFDIEVGDGDADKVTTIGAAVGLIKSKI
ncbi:acyl carrier protein [Leptospira sp. GIMC2001]|uniref:acyl carrier protein n=1 Tax=Leptospira sp. GIMC2001 TaxID=1513297 RepID=UPI00234B78C4|nr:phosphopantetheine-binding protein [Leptospira sp. GIMC2001]WCL50183.1 phosphopantetheine-binding protein [Leptospira sp. GIMC2001]